MDDIEDVKEPTKMLPVALSLVFIWLFVPLMFILAELDLEENNKQNKIKAMAIVEIHPKYKTLLDAMLEDGKIENSELDELYKITRGAK